jgi:hypothetical protein
MRSILRWIVLVGLLLGLVAGPRAFAQDATQEAPVESPAPALRGGAHFENTAPALRGGAPFENTAPALRGGAPLPSKLPAGFRMERDGHARWIYPSSADSEVAALKRAERKAWSALGRELGVTLPGNVDIRIGLDPAQMQALAPPGVPLPGYASGVALPEAGVIMLTFAAPGSWMRPDMERVLVHELSHVALFRAAGGHDVPRWFAEGVAIHQSGEHSIARVRSLWEGSARGDLIELSELSSHFPANEGQIDLAYAQAADVVGHMLEGDAGPGRFRALLTALRGGQPFEPALRGSYRVTLDQLERQWRAQLARRFGNLPAILSGLTVIWAIGALLLMYGYVQVRRRQRNTLKRWAIEEAPLLSPETVQPPPAPPAAPRSVADDVLDSWSDQQRRDSGVPTIVHEGRSYTLH